MMLGESTKTAVRGSVSGATGFVALTASMISVLVYGALILEMNLVILCIGGGVLTMGGMLLVLFACVKETKGVDLEKI